MSDYQFWKELMITQLSSASVSLVASTAIVAFISKNGLSTPYRRLIFGLSMSDICQSLAFVAGPWLVRADEETPQSLWGIGNKGTCQLDGFLFVVGITAAPMYTLCLCIYYVCKLRWKMTDDSFAHKVEKKMHAVIIVTNSCLYFTALGMDTINSSVVGNVCLTAAMPTGCRQNPDRFGECDERISNAAQFFTIINSFVVPVFCLFGETFCLAMIFWHVLTREKIFGGSMSMSMSMRMGRMTRSRSRLQQPHDSTGDRDGDADADADSDGHDNSDGDSHRHRHSHINEIPPRATTGQGHNGRINQRRGGYVQSFGDSSHLSPPDSNNAGIIDDHASSDLKSSTTHTNHNQSITLVSTRHNRTRNPQLYSDNDLESCQQENKKEPGVSLFPISLSSEDTTTANAGGLDDEVFRGTGRGRGMPSPSGNPRQGQASSSEHQQSRDAEILSRLYKKELLTQACCYVLIFCVSVMPFLIFQFLLVGGNQPSRSMHRALSLLYPLAGFFNIIVYTRPNVASLRRSCPQCSRLQAFWLVLKAGGEVPDVNDLNHTFFWTLGGGGSCLFFHCRDRNRNRNKHAFNLVRLQQQQQQQHPALVQNDELDHVRHLEAEEDGEAAVIEEPSMPPIRMANIPHGISQETISDLRVVGVASRPVVTTSSLPLPSPASNADANGRRGSFMEESNNSLSHSTSRATEERHSATTTAAAAAAKSKSVLASIPVSIDDGNGHTAEAPNDAVKVAASQPAQL